MWFEKKRWSVHSLILVTVFLLSVSSKASAKEFSYSFNDFGGIGLIEMRTARFAPDGTIAVGVHHSSRETRYFSTWQATPWLETTLSYTNDRSGNLGLDRSLDMKIRLMREGNYLPELAIGIQDALGSGRFDGEYLVASKRYYDVDFTMGLAWGYLGSRGGIGNMFRLFGNSFDRRSLTTSSGALRTGSYFAGQDMSFFAGAEYHTPIKGLTVKAEYSGVDTTKLAAFARLKRSRSFNFGLNYRATSWADVALGFDQGNRVSIRLTLRQNLHKLEFPRWFRGRKPAPIQVRGKEQTSPDNAARTAYKALKKRKLSPVSIRIDGQRAEVRKETGPYFADVKNIGRTARVLTGKMPDKVEEFTIISEKDGLEISRVSLLRRDLEKAASYQGSPEEIRVNSKIRPPGSGSPGQADTPRDDIYQPSQGLKFDWGFTPELLTHFGGNGEGRFRADLYAEIYGSIKIARKVKLSGILKQYIVGDIDRIPLDMRPGIPKVRSDIARYAKEGRTAIERLKIDYNMRVGRNFYARLTGGLLESMYGGVGAEILYRPYRRAFAFGLDINWVRQRGFNQLFSFRKYDIVTGQATFYHQNRDYNITSKLSVGRYLAGDYGATFDISRRFLNGVRIGAWATVTDMSSRDFGTGSFDKGIYITMPLEICAVRPSRQKMRFNFRSLGKNGGQMLDKGESLYDLLSTGTENRLDHQWREILK